MLFFRLFYYIKITTGTNNFGEKIKPKVRKKISECEGKQAKGNIYDLSQVDLSKWNQGSYNSAGDSAIDHFKRHGHEVGAEDVAHYVKKAEAFSKNLKRTKKSRVGGEVDGVIRYKKNGKYIDIAPDKTIISFGKQ